MKAKYQIPTGDGVVSLNDSEQQVRNAFVDQLVGGRFVYYPAEVETIDMAGDKLISLLVRGEDGFSPEFMGFAVKSIIEVFRLTSRELKKALKVEHGNLEEAGILPFKLFCEEGTGIKIGTGISLDHYLDLVRELTYWNTHSGFVARKHLYFGFGKAFEKAKEDLGIASTTGMSLEEIIRQAAIVPQRPSKQKGKTQDKRKGFIYLIENTDTGNVKIGFSANPEKRLKELQSISGCSLRIIGTKKGTQAREKELHRKFSQYRIRGEWFKPEQVILSEFVV